METKENYLNVIWLIGILIVPIYGNVQIIAEIDIGINLTALDTGASAQMPWVGPLPICNLALNDTFLAACLKTIANNIKQSWSYSGNGIPEFGIPNMDPCYFEEVSVNAFSPTLEFDATCTNLNITGLDGLTNVQLSISTEAHSSSINFTVPSIRVEGNYCASGTYHTPLLNIPISGDGKFWFQIDTITFFGTGSLNAMTVNGTRVLQTSNVMSDFTVTDYAFYFEGLGSLLAPPPLINTVAYLLRGKLLSSMKPEITAICNTLLVNVINPFFYTQPYLADRFE